MTAPCIDLPIVRGKTFEYAFLYADDLLIYKPITGMPSAAPVRLTVPNHGIPEGWPVAVSGVRQPRELNTEAGALLFARVLDDSTIELNTVDAATLRPFVVSGSVVFNTPVDLTGWTARATVRERVGGQELLRWSTDTQDAGAQLITIDVAHSAFILHIDAATTAALPWSRGVWEMEAIDPQGGVYPVVGVSKISVSTEVVI